jgi:hypothetical protein
MNDSGYQLSSVRQHPGIDYGTGVDQCVQLSLSVTR